MKKTAEHFLPYALPAAAIGFFLIVLVIGTTVGLTWAVEYLYHGRSPFEPTMIPGLR